MTENDSNSQCRASSPTHAYICSCQLNHADGIFVRLWRSALPDDDSGAGSVKPSYVNTTRQLRGRATLRGAFTLAALNSIADRVSLYRGRNSAGRVSGLGRRRSLKPH